MSKPPPPPPPEKPNSISIPATTTIVQHIAKCEICVADPFGCEEHWRLVEVLASANEGISTQIAQDMLKTREQYREMNSIFRLNTH